MLRLCSPSLILGQLLTLSLAAPALAQPANDVCGQNQGSHTLAGMGGTVNGTFSAATLDAGSSACGVGTQDVYYYFTPGTPGSYVFSTCGSSINTVLSIHTGCPATTSNYVGGAPSAACNDDYPTCGNRSQFDALLSSGMPIVIRVARASGGGGSTFTLVVTRAPDNNTCGQNQAAHTIPAAGGTVSGTFANATQDNPAGSVCSTSGVDAFYYFTPAQSGAHRFSTCGSSGSAGAQVSIHTGCPASAANYVGGASGGACGVSVSGCSGGTRLDSVPLTAGVPVVVRVGKNGSGGSDAFTLSVTPNPTGACCQNTGGCSIDALLECTGSRTFAGAGTTCASGPCGACCAPGGFCTVTAPGSCTGVFAGPGSFCSPTPCGACCAPGGGCAVSTSGSCAGVFAGAGALCAPSPCGACCAAGGGCSMSTAGICAGVFVGSGTTCAPNPCGACCAGPGACAITTSALCGGAFLGAGTTCAPGVCGSCHTGQNFIVGTSPATTNSGSRNGTTFRVADNFHPLTGGTLSRISWTGLYRSGLGSLASNYHNAAPPAAETWTIRIYQDVGGMPGPEIVGSPLTATTGVEVVRAPDSTFLASYPADFYGAGSPAYGETYQYHTHTFTIPPANRPTLLATNCYWLGVTAASPSFDTAFNTTGLHWRWAFDSTSSGDEYCHQRPEAATLFNFITRVGGDMRFCLDLEFSESSPCFVPPLPPTCPHPVANGQVYDNNGVGYFSGAGDFNTADDFRLATPAALTGLCFDGFYSGGGGPPLDEAFIVRIYASAGPHCPLFPGAIIATFNLVPDASTGATIVPTPGTSIAANIQPGSASNSAFRYTASLGVSPPMLAPGTYWIEVVAQSSTRWLWFRRVYSGTPTKDGNGLLAQRPPPAGTFTSANLLVGDDLVFFLSAELAVPTNAPMPLASNRTCAGAQALVLNAAPVPGQNVNVGNPAANSNVLPSGFGLDIDPNHAGVWYTLLGNGAPVTISTCGTGVDPCFGPTATFNTRLSVFCATNCSGFKAIADNDDENSFTCPINLPGVNVGAAGLVLPTVAGQEYLIYVHGLNGATGTFWISATSAPGTGVGAPCADIQVPPCVVVRPGAPGPNDVIESGVCGAGGTDPNFNCLGAQSLFVGQTGWGTISNDGTNADTDMWRIQPSTGTTFSIFLRAETSVVLDIHAGACPGDGATNPPQMPGQIRVVLPCGDPATPSANVLVPSGDWYIRLTPLGRHGVPCGPMNVGNRYALRVEHAVVGACCFPGGACTIRAYDLCVITGSTFLTWTGAGSTCAASCDGTTGAPIQPEGLCCRSNGACLRTTGAGCDGVFMSAGASCQDCPVVQRCCMNDGTCIARTQSTCFAGVWSPGACLPNFCPAMSSAGACCTNPAAACVVMQQATCNGPFLGVGVPCGPADPCEFGACCNLAGVCDVRPVYACLYPPRIFQSGACTPAFCGSPGACCNLSTGTCLLIPEVFCARPDLGPATFVSGACSPTPCPPGACCAADGTCSVTSAANCTGTSFTLAGVCVPNTCPPAHACCTAGVCSVIIDTICTGGGGVVQSGNTCAPSPCAPQGVCCRGATCVVSAVLSSQTACAASVSTGTPGAQAGAKFVVAGACGGLVHTSPCCYADYDQSNVRNVSDIFKFLTDWFAGRPWARTGGDGTGVPQVSHIFGFLTDWFAGGCP